MSDPKVFVDPPRRVARKGGIKSLGEFVLTPRLGVAANVEYIANSCAWPSGAPGLCWGNVISGDKTFDGVLVEQGITSIFAQYAGVECFLGQGHEEEFLQRARETLITSEAHEVEAVLIGWAEAGTVSGTATSVAEAIAKADEYADQKYVGQHVLLMSRHMAVLGDKEGVLHSDRDGNIWTINGTPVVATWISAENKIVGIGWPTVYASEIVTAATKHLSLNREMALAERIYGVAVDCQFRGVITVTLAASDPAGGGGTPPLVMLLGSIPSSPIPDGTDTTLVVQTNRAPDAEVYVKYSINGGPWQTTPELTQTSPTEYVHNVVGGDTTSGDTVALYAVSGSVESNHIEIEVT